MRRASRAAGLPYADPQQALILASIVEKETGRDQERPVGTVLLPELSRRLQAGDSAGGREAFNRGTEFALLLTLPPWEAPAAGIQGALLPYFPRPSWSAGTLDGGIPPVRPFPVADAAAPRSPGRATPGTTRPATPLRVVGRRRGDVA